jgi:1-aminocyclopropane-1-carboxylate deaminase
MQENLQNIKIQRLINFSSETIQVDVLRLDLFHPIISGNKWFKLQFYLEEAIRLGKKSIATFGGAYSNHIVATACAANELGLESLGLIRGNEEGSGTLEEAKKYGMKLVFINREEYRNKELIKQVWDAEDRYWIMEGGYGVKGAEGAAEILAVSDTTHYSHILCAVGTGTMMAGLIKTATPKQQVTGISVLKNHLELENEIRSLLTATENKKHFTLNHDYHFGGYAKQTEPLFTFMKALWLTEAVPTDIVYTSKLLYGVQDLLKRNYFPAGSNILIIHSGGLQGNRSLQEGILPF